VSLTNDLSQWAAPFPPPSAAELADRLAVSQLVKIYALGIDMRDYALCRSAFSDDALMVGTQGSALIEAYLPKVYEGAAAFAATQHNITNQHVTIDRADALVWSYAIAVHKAAPDSGRDDLTMGVQYRDTCRRFPAGWLITARTVVVQWTEKPPRAA
jgi:hypothetical protein